MKKLLITVLIIALLLSGCGSVNENSDEKEADSGKSGIAESGMWFSYNDINTMLTSEKGFSAELLNAVENCKSAQIKNVYIHVRAFCDSLYKSELFPLVRQAESYEQDVFREMLTAFKNEGIKVHAWINPYRVQTSSEDVENLPKLSPAYKWLCDDNSSNDSNVCFYNGIYLNPASNEVQKLVLDGIREILDGYSVDGIHFDDYFYPTTEQEFDAARYELYKAESKNPMSLDDWRRANVNALISGAYTLIKGINPDVVFSVSPAADIEDNYVSLFADVGYWIENGYVDYIMPQLYFGFEYPNNSYKFGTLLRNWKKLIARNRKVELFIGLASYKTGTELSPDCDEWGSDEDILARQAELCYQDGDVSGYVFFSYNSFFSLESLNIKQRENYMKFLSK